MFNQIQFFQEIFKNKEQKNVFSNVGQNSKLNLFIEDINHQGEGVSRIDDKVIFTGFVVDDDLPYFYNACELFIYPSLYEGFGLPPLEAMACGVPVISSNVTSIPEVCKNSAILIDPNDIDELSYSMERVLTDSFLKLTMIERGLSTSNNYSWKNTALTTIKAYENIIRY